MNLNDLNNLEGLTHLTSKYTDYESILQNIREFESQKETHLSMEYARILGIHRKMSQSETPFEKDGVYYKLEGTRCYFGTKSVGKVEGTQVVFMKTWMKLHKRLSELIQTYQTLIRKRDQLITQIQTTDLDRVYPKEYQNLPDPNYKQWQADLSQKAEFQTNILKDKQTCEKSKFQLKPSQTFLKSFLSKETPYRSVLLFHGTGTGKTCSGVTVAENFRDSLRMNDQKTIILCPKNIIDNWKQTIFTSEKDENQCTGETYVQKIVNESNRFNESRAMIRKNYDILGYRKFSNRILSNLELDLSQGTLTEFQKTQLKTYFQDRVIIIDEVHNIRDETDGKDIMKLLRLIVRYSQNVRLILLSATPMFNQSIEIINLLNLMLLNDKRFSELVDKRDIFDDKGQLKTEPDSQGVLPSDRLKRLFRVYISYSRGENYETFPVRLYPPSIVYPKKSFNGTNLDNPLQFLPLYGSKLDKPDPKQPLSQTSTYYRELRKIQHKQNLQIDDEIKMMQVSNMSFPFKNFFTGEKGLKLSMIATKRDRSVSYRYQKPILKKFGPLFDKSHIGIYSKKIESLIDIINQSNGIVFVYSNYIQSGLIPLALALEHQGYTKYDSDPLLNYDKKDTSVKRGNYIVLSSDDKLSSNMMNELEICKSEGNRMGDKIKVVLGTSVASEGLDFKNIRMIHILDPWHHMNRLEQVIGRGIRYCSHTELPLEDRNVLVYLHVLQIHDNSRETTDMTIYRLAESKAVNIGQIERLLKESSIDCTIMNVSKPTGLKRKVRPPFQRAELIEVSLDDKPYSKICSYSDTCTYECNSTSYLETKNLDTLDIKSFKPVLYQLCDQIKQLFQQIYSIDCNQLIRWVREQDIECTEDVIYLAMNVLTSERNNQTKINKGGIEGYIHHSGSQYLFQPDTLGSDKNPFMYRYTKRQQSNPYITLTQKRNRPKQVKKLSPDLTEVKLDSEPIRDKLQSIRSFSKSIYESYLLDRLPLQIKAKVLKELVINFPQSLSNPLYKSAFHHFQRNLIYLGTDIGRQDVPYVFDYKLPETTKPLGYRLFTGKTFQNYLIDKSLVIELKPQDERVKDIQRWLPIYKQTPEYQNTYVLPIQDTVWGYIFSNTKGQYLFKLVDRGNTVKPGFRAKGHRDCNGQQTGDLSRDILRQLQDKVPDMFTDEIESKLFAKEVSRFQRCQYVELCLRELDLLYSYDTVFLMKI